MENPVNVRYCIDCGSAILEDYGFCPACGRYYENPSKKQDGSANVRTEQMKGPSPEEIAEVQQAYQRYAEEYRRRVNENQYKANLFMIGIWVAMSAMMFLSLQFDLSGFGSSLNSFFGFGDHPEFESQVLGFSCISAAVSFLCSLRRKNWALALITCLASGISTLALFYVGETICIYLFLFGMLASLRIKNIRRMFAN